MYSDSSRYFVHKAARRKVGQESELDDLEKRIPDEGMCASSSVPESGNF